MKYEQIARKKFKALIKASRKQDVLVLAFETSCDETSVAVVKNGREVLANIVSSQIEIHARFGGVVPEVASRNHLMSIEHVLQQALDTAGVTLQQIDAIAVTYGAGLVGALLVGVSFAKSLAYALELPLIKVNHIHGHISANYIATPDLKPPFISLVVSGGHTAILNVTAKQKTLIATTHDDAIGEAYDKVAKVLGLGYPGGPKVDKLAKEGKPTIQFIKKPKEKNAMSFSYSGLKTAVINYLHKAKQHNQEIDIPTICASFQAEAVEEVVHKSLYACKKYKRNTLVLAGGVAANSYLREQLQLRGKEMGIRVVIPPLSLCGDNAAMIGAEAYESIKLGKNLAGLDLNAQSNLNLKFVK